jgi:hypothetical protein
MGGCVSEEEKKKKKKKKDFFSVMRRIKQSSKTIGHQLISMNESLETKTSDALSRQAQRNQRTRTQGAIYRHNANRFCQCPR